MMERLIGYLLKTLCALSAAWPDCALMKTNRREFEDAAEEFMKWTKAGGRVLPGLVKRRQDERALYLSGIN
jgi:GH24 family phage-related lysozyme (muramidase)